MAMLNASNDPFDYTPKPNVSIDSGHSDLTRVPYALQMPNNTTHRQAAPHPESSTDTTWYRFHKYAFHWSPDDGYFVEMRNTALEILGVIELLNGKAASKVYGDSTVVGAYTPAALGTYVWLDIKMVVSASEVTMSLYVDGTLVSTATSTNTASKGKPTYLDFPVIDTVENSSMYVSEIMASEESTIGLRMNKRPAVADGFHVDFLNGVVGDLSDSDDVTGKSSKIDGDRMSHTIDSLTIPTGIRAVILSSRCSKDGTSPTNLRHGFRIGSTDYDAAAAEAVPAVVGAVHTVFTNDPSTGLAWTDAGVSAAEPMVKAET